MGPQLGTRLIVVLFGGVFIAIGNLLPRTRPNLALGIRTTRTLTNRHLWIKLHWTCGYVAVAFGTLIAISGLFLREPALGLVIGAAANSSIAALVVMYQIAGRYGHRDSEKDKQVLRHAAI